MSIIPDTAAGHVSHEARGEMPNGFSVEYVSQAGLVTWQEAYEAACRLRANVYIDQMGFLPDEHRRQDGTEKDEYDDRSTHVVVADLAAGQLDPRVHGTMRFIERGPNGAQLPMEHYFAGYLERLGDTAIEGSRFIARHPQKSIQAGISLSLTGAFLGYGLSRGAELCAIIEAPLLRHLKVAGLVIEPLGEPRVISEYGDTINYPVRIDAAKTLARVQDNGRFARSASFFMRALFNQGAGPVYLEEAAA